MRASMSVQNELPVLTLTPWLSSCRLLAMCQVARATGPILFTVAQTHSYCVAMGTIVLFRTFSQRHTSSQLSSASFVPQC